MKTQRLILRLSHLLNSVTFYIYQITFFPGHFHSNTFPLNHNIYFQRHKFNEYPSIPHKTWVNMVNIATTLLFLTNVPSLSAGMFHFFFLWISWNAASNHSYDFKNDAPFWNCNCSANYSYKSGTGLRQRCFHQMKGCLLLLFPFPEVLCNEDASWSFEKTSPLAEGHAKFRYRV